MINRIAILGVAMSASLGLGTMARAEGGSSHLGSAAQQQRAAAWNSQHSVTLFDNWNVLRPFSEMETSGYVAISGEDDFELPALREAIAKNLPAGVNLIVYVSDDVSVDGIKQDLGQYLGDRLKFVSVPSGGDPIWGRDSLPFPVVLKGAGLATTYGLVGSIYPQDFDPNAAFQKALNLPMASTHEYFRGGNLLIDDKAACFAENVNEVGSLQDPQTFFSKYFGCASITLLDQEGGIGDIDERIKFLGNNIAITDNDAYAQQLQAKGYIVKRIPTTGDNYETYMNTLFVNGTFFVPQMGIDADAAAVKAYQDLGYQAVGVYTKQLADDGEGNIHCVTMNYPAGTFQPTLRPDFVEFATSLVR